MNREEELEKKLKEYQELGEKNKDIDVASLALNAMRAQNENLVSARKKRWAYLISVAIPPLGLLFALKYYLSDKSDAIRVAKICVILTVAVIVFYWLMTKAFIGSSGVDLDQLQQINPQDLQDLLR